MDIQYGDWFCSVREQGGLVTALRCGDWDVLRPAVGAADRLDPTAAAAFVMAPFAGRIAQGQLQWRGQQFQLAVPANEKHAIHGHGWQFPWQLWEQQAGALALGYEWTGSGSQSHWPWAYRLQQRLSLSNRGLEIALELTNLSASDMPAGLGWHPYFQRDDAQLAMPVSHMWSVNEEVLPQQRLRLSARAALPVGESVASTTYDNPFELQGSAARLHWPDAQRELQLQWSAGQSRHFAVIFNHPTENCFCVEPVTHVPNRIDDVVSADRTGLQGLAPSESLRLRCAILLPDAPKQCGSF